MRIKIIIILIHNKSFDAITNASRIMKRDRLENRCIHACIHSCVTIMESTNGCQLNTSISSMQNVE